MKNKIIGLLLILTPLALIFFVIGVLAGFDTALGFFGAVIILVAAIFFVILLLCCIVLGINFLFKD